MQINKVVHSMARRNPFRNINTNHFLEDQESENKSLTSKDEAECQLPWIDFPSQNTEISFVDKNGGRNTLVLDAKFSQQRKSVNNKNAKGKKYLPWFHELFSSMPNEAIELARVSLYFMQEVGEFHKYTSLVREIANYINNKKIAISKLTVKQTTEIIELAVSDYERKGALGKNNAFKRVCSLLPSLDASVKAFLVGYRLPLRMKKKIYKSAEERIANTSINNDYSDYIMFQLYAYLNAMITEIKNTIIKVESAEFQFNTVDMLTPEGRELYRERINSCSPLEYEKALDMEFLVAYRLNIANTLLMHSISNGYDISDLKAALKKFDYERAYKCLPKEHKNEPNVKYLIKSIFGFGAKNKKVITDTLLTRLGSENGPNAHTIFGTFWSTEALNRKEYTKFIIGNSFTYRVFVPNKNDVMSTQLCYYKILLGGTAHFDFLILLLLLCESGRNKEVLTSIPAKINVGEKSASILDIQAPFCTEPTVLLTGYKVRGHVNNTGKQEENITIPHKSALFSYLCTLDRLHLFKYPGRELFFITRKNYKHLLKEFSKGLPIKDENQNSISSIQSTKFRKVFAGEALLEHLSGISTPDDLIAAVGEDLRNTIPLTYLLQSSRTETMLANAITGLQLRFIGHHLEVAAQLKLTSETMPQNANGRYLCECTDPMNPEFIGSIESSYCRQFDSCLGCNKAVIYEEHIKNIIYRCFQYEDLLKRNRDLYSAHYELKHQMALEVLEKYKSTAPNGEEKHAMAFSSAMRIWEDKNIHLLPPIIHQNINIMAN